MTDANEVWIVLCNAPDLETARVIADTLLRAKMAACVNLGSPCESVYRWQGAVESAMEIPMMIKTVSRRYADVESTIRALHPYQVPEIVAVPLVAGASAYLEWVRGETVR
jgi:periplasmic divalent cation tolerance protein